MDDGLFAVAIDFDLCVCVFVFFDLFLNTGVIVFLDLCEIARIGFDVTLCILVGMLV